MAEFNPMMCRSEVPYSSGTSISTYSSMSVPAVSVTNSLMIGSSRIFGLGCGDARQRHSADCRNGTRGRYFGMRAHKPTFL